MFAVNMDKYVLTYCKHVNKYTASCSIHTSACQTQKIGEKSTLFIPLLAKFCPLISWVICKNDQKSGNFPHLVYPTFRYRKVYFLFIFSSINKTITQCYISVSFDNHIVCDNRFLDCKTFILL